MSCYRDLTILNSQWTVHFRPGHSTMNQRWHAMIFVWIRIFGKFGMLWSS